MNDEIPAWKQLVILTFSLIVWIAVFKAIERITE